MATQLRSYSKINLGLAIGPPRPDGFHALATVYQTLELHDLVTVAAIQASATRISLTTNDARVPVDHHNTAWRMVAAALGKMGLHAEVHIHIEKRLPVQGGLGAGSANAAAALIGLERELGFSEAGELKSGETLRLGLTTDQAPGQQGSSAGLSDRARLACAAEVGSDVPLFLLGGTVLGVGRGEDVSLLSDLPSMWCVVAAPAIGVSTPQAFQDWDKLHLRSAEARAREGNPGKLTSNPSSDRLSELSRKVAAAWATPHSSGVSALGRGLAENPLLALVRTGIENDFEEVVFPQYPLLGTIKRLLEGPPGSGHEARAGDRDHQALYAALSGSGSALFGLYQAEAAALAAYERLESKGVQGFLTRTIAREEYWREMVVPNAGAGLEG